MIKTTKTKVYSLDIKNGIIRSRFLGELNGRNIVHPNKLNIESKIINKYGDFIRYKLFNNFLRKEISFLENQLIEAVDMVKKSIDELNNNTLLALETLTDVFLAYDGATRNKVLKKFLEIYEVLISGFLFNRKDVYEENGKDLDYVYISTNPDIRTTTIYNKFFEHDEYFDRIFTRSSWLIHEASHLTGLREEAGSEVFDNAESYRKFACLICNVATFEELYPNGNTGKTLPLKSNIGRKEFPGPDQPRDKAGRWESKDQYSEDDWEVNKRDRENDSLKNTDKNLKNTDVKKSIIETKIQFNDRGITSNGNDIWGAIDVSISGLEPDSPFTVKLEVSYEQYDKTGNILESFMDNNKPAWAYDVVSDSNGKLTIKRAGLMGQDTNNSVSSYQGDNIRGDLNINIYEGKFSDNFNPADKVEWDTGQKDLSPYQVNMQNKYGLGSYGAAHASNNAYVASSNKPSGVTKGGGIYSQISKNPPVWSSSWKFDYDKETNKSVLKK